MSRNPGMKTIGECGFENILAGDYHRVTEAITLMAGRVYPAGAVIGMITATQLGVLVESGKSDGSQTVYGVLADEVDATSQNMPAVVFLTGEFNQNRLTFGGSDTFAVHKNAARAKSIFFKDAALHFDAE